MPHSAAVISCVQLTIHAKIHAVILQGSAHRQQNVTVPAVRTSAIISAQDCDSYSIGGGPYLSIGGCMVLHFGVHL